MFQRIRQIAASADKLSFLAPTLIRITLGVVFIVSGWGKLHSLDNVTSYFTELGIPMPGLNARVASATEFFGGLLFLVGLGARLAALPLAFTMVIAIITARAADVTGVASLLGLEEWCYLVMFLVIALRGAGPLSLDALLARRFAKARDLPSPRLAPAAA